MKKTTLLVLLVGVFSSTVMRADESGRPTGSRPDPTIHSSYWRTANGPALQSGSGSNSGGGGSNTPSQPSEEPGLTPQPYGDWFNWPDVNGLFRRSNGHSGSVFSLPRRASPPSQETPAQETPETPSRPSHAMPEPGGIGELAVCVFGVGVYAWRRRKL